VPDGDYLLDPAASVFAFAATAFLLLPVKGTIRARAGSVHVADGKIAAEGSADAGSIATGIKARDWHLRYKHYLHAAVHPEIRLVIPPVGLDADTVTATLYARGNSVQLPLALEALEVSPDGTVHARLTGSFDRAPLRMLPRLGGVSQRIHLSFDVVARKEG
jgi:polyisoprenoid-binding protein YceI